MQLNNEQYQILSSRRLATDGLLWQTPVLSLTAQAFLFNIALGSNSTIGARLLSAILAFVVALCSIQLMSKHRLHEIDDSKKLRKYETENKLGTIHGPRDIKKKPWYCKISSYRLWICILAIFAITALLVIIGLVFSWEWIIGFPEIENHENGLLCFQYFLHNHV
jgi:uncharacterized membrane protein YhaH (DUF805 family)